MASLIIQRDYEDATEFLKALSVTSALWAPNPGLWIFRGHWDCSWRLLPSINRPSSVRQYRDVGDGADYFEPAYEVELELRSSFAEVLNEAGLHVPNGDIFREGQARQYSPTHRRTLDLLAMAQHHGMPTRLLDWTPHGLYAAYFAAEGVVRATVTSGQMEVWGLRLPSDPASRTIISAGQRGHVELVQVPRATSKNQHAQGGLFTIAEYPGVADDAPRRVQLEQRVGPTSVDELAEGAILPEGWLLPLMYRLRLPQALSGELLWRLSHVPVHGVNMFPGLDGVGRLMREKKHWPHGSGLL